MRGRGRVRGWKSIREKKAGLVKRKRDMGSTGNTSRGEKRKKKRRVIPKRVRRSVQATRRHGGGVRKGHREPHYENAHPSFKRRVRPKRNRKKGALQKRGGNRRKGDNQKKRAKHEQRKRPSQTSVKRSTRGKTGKRDPTKWESCNSSSNRQERTNGGKVQGSMVLGTRHSGARTGSNSNEKTKTKMNTRHKKRTCRTWQKWSVCHKVTRLSKDERGRKARVPVNPNEK